MNSETVTESHRPGTRGDSGASEPTTKHLILTDENGGEAVLTTESPAPAPMNGRKLRAVFQDFNRRYFGGTLPPYHIRVVPQITWLGESGRCISERRLIEIQRGVPGSPECILLHEMIHAAVPGEGHGPKFFAEFARLNQAGAPLDQTDLNTYQTGEGYPLERLTKSTLEAHYDDILTDCPSVSLKAAARWIVRNYGYAGSVAGFLRRYPWAKKLFRERKRSYREEQKRRAAFRARVADAEVKKGA